MIMIGAGQKNSSTYLKNSFKIFKTIPSPNCLTWGNKILLEAEIYPIYFWMYFSKNAPFSKKCNFHIQKQIDYISASKKAR